MLLKQTEHFKKNFANRLGGYFNTQPLTVSQNALLEWYASPLGARIIANEQAEIDRLLPEVYGQYLMQLSVLDDGLNVEKSSVVHPFHLSVNSLASTRVISEFERLPIDSESIDSVILHHVLEYSTSPHQLIRESARTLVSNGYMIIIGFNPWSMLFFKKILARSVGRGLHWRYHTIQKKRVVDWLQVLDLDVVYSKQADFCLPFGWHQSSNVEKLGKWLMPAFGSFYMIVARKSVMPVTMIKKPWKNKPRLAAWAKPALLNPQNSRRDETPS